MSPPLASSSRFQVIRRDSVLHRALCPISYHLRPSFTLCKLLWPFIALLRARLVNSSYIWSYFELLIPSPVILGLLRSLCHLHVVKSCSKLLVSSPSIFGLLLPSVGYFDLFNLLWNSFCHLRPSPSNANPQSFLARFQFSCLPWFLKDADDEGISIKFFCHRAIKR